MKIELTNDKIKLHSPSYCGTNKYPCNGEKRAQREYTFMRADSHYDMSGPYMEVKYKCDTCKKIHIVEVELG